MTIPELSDISPTRKRHIHPTPLAIRLEIDKAIAKDGAEGNQPPIPARVSSLIDKAITRACLAHEAEE